MSDIEYGDEEDEYFDDDWYDNPDDYVMTDRCPLETMADPVFMPDLMQDDDESEFEYESDHFYDDDSELFAHGAKKKRLRGPGLAQEAPLGILNGLSSLSIDFQQNSPSSKSKSTAPVLFARVDPGLTARPKRQYIYEPGHGEVVSLLKNWRDIFAETRPSKPKLWKRKEQVPKRRFDSLDAKRATTATPNSLGTESDLESPGTPVKEPILPGIIAIVAGELRPSLAELGPLELRPTSPPPHSIDHPPSGTTNLEASPRRTTEGEAPITKASPPSPPRFSEDNNADTTESERNITAEELQLHGTSNRVLKKRKADEITSSEMGGPRTPEKRPDRKRKVLERTSTRDEPATPLRRSVRNSRKK